MAFPLMLALRAVQGLFAIIILGLTAYGMQFPAYLCEEFQSEYVLT